MHGAEAYRVEPLKRFTQGFLAVKDGLEDRPRVVCSKEDELVARRN